MSAMPAVPLEQASAPDGFDALDLCHRQSLLALGKLTAMVARLTEQGPDREVRDLAEEVIRHFSTTARQHHADEEAHVFPRLAAGGDPEIVQAVLRLQQDHDWLEEDWMELAPHLEAVASGQSWYDIDLLRHGSEVFIALMHDHMALEESYLYPEARARLNARERVAMGREMAARRRHARRAAGPG